MAMGIVPRQIIRENDEIDDHEDDASIQRESLERKILLSTSWS